MKNELEILLDTIKSIDWESYKTKDAAAKRLYRLLYDFAEFLGMKPEVEVSITTPKQSKEYGYGPCWTVTFEAGPYEWATNASWYVCSRKNGWFTEPYYSFNLCFTE